MVTNELTVVNNETYKSYVYIYIQIAMQFKVIFSMHIFLEVTCLPYPMASLYITLDPFTYIVINVMHVTTWS
jgi:hypothetical protein